MRSLAILTVLALVAGCSDAPAGEDPGVPPVPTKSGTGVIRGVVVDLAVSPVPEATVRLQDGQETTTGDEGQFAFADLEPGIYFATVSKPGWSTVQQQATVEADNERPPMMRVMLERLPGTEPVASTFSAEGFIQCGAGTPLTFHVCPLYDDQDKSTVTIPFTGAPDHIQVETTWKSTQPAGEQLYLLYYFCDGTNCGQREDRWDEGNRDGPWIARTTGEGRSDLVCAVYASPGGPANGTGLSIDQPFQVYATFFYNIEEPDPDWAFIEDGEYPT